jgi:hypothetical protein
MTPGPRDGDNSGSRPRPGGVRRRIPVGPEPQIQRWPLRVRVLTILFAAALSWVAILFIAWVALWLSH